MKSPKQSKTINWRTKILNKQTMITITISLSHAHDFFASSLLSQKILSWLIFFSWSFINHLASTIIFWMTNVEAKQKSRPKFLLCRHKQYTSQNKIYKLKFCIVRLPNIFALHFAQCSIGLFRDRKLEQMRIFWPAVGSAKSRDWATSIVEVFCFLIG